MRIPEGKVEEVRLASDIVSVVGEYVSLRKKGQNYFGLCPFHQENTPSFSVHPGRQIFRCFGCSRGGNVFGFLMEVERITFVEAVRHLAEKAGIALPTYRDQRDDDEPSEAELIVRANGLARDFFYQQLTGGNSTGAKEARDYLSSRGYGTSVIEKFMIGYAPDAWDGLSEHARGSGFGLPILVKAGLLKEGRETGRPYDAFRHRVMFPIRNLSGRAIGFGGRRLREEAEGPDSAKYINSPETEVYHKGRELFGLWEARNTIRKEDRAILVEGYTDAISLAMAGVECVTASLGTSLTEDQARLLKRFTSNVFILYDGDSAGLNAARRAVDILLGIGVFPRVVVLPENEDPDSFVQKNGGEATWEKVNNAADPVEFQIALSKRAGSTNRESVRGLLTSAALIDSPVDREMFLRTVGEKLGVSLDALLRELPQVRSPQANRNAEPKSPDWPPKGAVTELARILVRQPALRGEIFRQWQPSDIADSYLALLLGTLYADWKAQQSKEPQALLDQFSEAPLRDFVSQCLIEDDLTTQSKLFDVDRQTAVDCLRNLKSIDLRIEIAVLKQQLAAAPDSLELLRELQELLKKEQALK